MAKSLREIIKLKIYNGQEYFALNSLCQNEHLEKCLKNYKQFFWS